MSKGIPTTVIVKIKAVRKIMYVLIFGLNSATCIIFDFEFMLDNCNDHVMLIQEHWRLKEELHTWQALAHLKGWQGVWEPAKVTGKCQDGITGRSGGVAILTWMVYFY